MSFFPVILCGGSGTRLWPLSRTAYPKQFVKFDSDNTLFQQTLERSTSIVGALKPIVVSNKSHQHFVRQNLSDLNQSATLIMEPEAKNTAPAIALAALAAFKEDPEAILLVLPSDHVIKGQDKFQEAVKYAIDLAKANFIVTFGIVPTGPETGFGYIEKGEAINENAYKVEQFVEKPKLEKAKEMIDRGSFYWNSGMFVFKASTFLGELKRYAPEVYKVALDSLEQGQIDIQDEGLTLVRPRADVFGNCPSDSIDYAVMEKTQKVAVVPLDLDWSDMGAWSSFYQLGEKDKDGNVIHGEVFTHSTQNCYINSTSRLIATVGIDNLAIVETKDALFISSLDRVQEVKQIVAKLKEFSMVQADLPPVVRRPWGSYESLAVGSQYQTKRIIVRPGEQLSLQLHHHRSEHWTVVEGNPEITVGDNTKTYYPNESVYIPKESVHRLTNRTCQNVTIIEVQCGDYLGEDDIVRLEDKYFRN